MRTDVLTVVGISTVDQICSILLPRLIAYGARGQVQEGGPIGPPSGVGVPGAGYSGQNSETSWAANCWASAQAWALQPGGKLLIYAWLRTTGRISMVVVAWA